MQIDELCSEVMSDVKNEGYQFDPITLEILMGILSGIVGHYVEKCLNGIDSKVIDGISNFKQPNRLQRWGLKMAINSGFDNCPDPTLKAKYADVLYNKLLERAATTPEGVMMVMANGLKRP